MPDFSSPLTRYQRIREISTGDVFEVMQVGQTRDGAPGGDLALIRTIYKVRRERDHGQLDVKDSEIGEGKRFEVV